MPMERPSTPISRLHAPSVLRTNGGTPSTPPTNGVPAKRGSRSGLVPPSAGIRRPSVTTPTATTTTSTTTMRPRRASDETAATQAPQSGGGGGSHSQTPQPTPTTTFLRRGSGRTIATLGNPNIATQSPPPVGRRKSGSPPKETAVGVGVGGTQSPAPARVVGSPQVVVATRSSIPSANRPNPHIRPRGGSRDHGVEVVLAAMKQQQQHQPSSPQPQQQPQQSQPQSQPQEPVFQQQVTTNNTPPPPLVQPQAQQQQQQQQLYPISPKQGASILQRKRSADMMEMMELQAAATAVQSSLYQADANQKENEEVVVEEVDEPPVPYSPRNQESFMTPPPRYSSGSGGGGMDAPSVQQPLPMSPPDAKRMKRLAYSPKTPLGSCSNVAGAPEEGGSGEAGVLSASQRVRLSLSGYMTIAGLTSGPGSRRDSTGARDSGIGAFLNRAVARASANRPQQPQPVEASSSATMQAITVPSPSSSKSADHYKSPGSVARSKQFATSRSMSGPAVQSSLLTSKNSVDCLMGYIRELQVSEARLRLQVEQTKNQNHDELSRSLFRVASLENAISRVESEREMEKRQCDEQQRMIEALMNQVAFLQQQQQQQQQQNDAANLYYDNNEQGGPEYAGQWEADAYAMGSTTIHTPPRSHTTTGTESIPSFPESGGGGGMYDEDAGTPPQHQEQWASQYQAAQDEAHSDAHYDQPSSYHDQYQYQDPYQADPNAMYQPKEYEGEEDRDEPVPPAQTHMMMASPLIKLTDAVWNPAHSMRKDDAPPVFMVAPRLSDIIAPLSRSNVFLAAANDHNVLTPVTPEALSGAKLSARDKNEWDNQSKKQQQQQHQQSPSPLHGQQPELPPPVFTMGDLSTPPSSTTRSRLSPPQDATEVVVNGQVEYFQPAASVFKPFIHPTPPSSVERRHHSEEPQQSPASKSAAADHACMASQLLEKSLVEFYTVVDKNKIPQAAPLVNRYKGRVDRLFIELAKKYPVRKTLVAEIKRKYDHEISELAQVGTAKSSPPSPTKRLIFSPETVAADEEKGPLVAPPMSPEITRTGIFSAQSHSIVEGQRPFFMSSSSLVMEEPAMATTPQQTTEHRMDATAAAAHPSTMGQPSAVKMPSPHKVSPTDGSRHGGGSGGSGAGPSLPPPLAFTFVSATEAASDHHQHQEQQQREEQQEDAMPAAVPVSTPVLSDPATRSPLRLSPSPPRVPPPQGPMRSPVRNASVLRQRVSPRSVSRRQQHEQAAAAFPPVASGLTNEPTWSVTLESLLKEFYRKHQPDRLTNVPQVVAQYTGKERELITVLKTKYGAFSIKSLEQNLEILDRQNALAGKNQRGWRRKLVAFVATLCVVIVFVAASALGGVVMWNHFYCQSPQTTGTTAAETAVKDCASFDRALQAFDVSAAQQEPQECFCHTWVGKEATFRNEPRLVHAMEVAKLVPFSRATMEPAVTKAIDLYTDVTTAVTRQWALLVEMYKEEGPAPGLEAVGEMHDIVGRPVEDAKQDKVDGAAIVSSMDALTKVAMASKSLAAPSENTASNRREEIEQAAVVSTDAHTSDVGERSHENAAVQPEDESDTIVEIVVEQVGLEVVAVEEDVEVQISGLKETTVVEQEPQHSEDDQSSRTTVAAVVEVQRVVDDGAVAINKGKDTTREDVSTDDDATTTTAVSVEESVEVEHAQAHSEEVVENDDSVVVDTVEAHGANEIAEEADTTNDNSSLPVQEQEERQQIDEQNETTRLVEEKLLDVDVNDLSSPPALVGEDTVSHTETTDTTETTETTEAIAAKVDAVASVQTTEGHVAVEGIQDDDTILIAETETEIEFEPVSESVEVVMIQEVSAGDKNQVLETMETATSSSVEPVQQETSDLEITHGALSSATPADLGVPTTSLGNSSHSDENKEVEKKEEDKDEDEDEADLLSLLGDPAGRDPLELLALADLAAADLLSIY